MTRFYLAVASAPLAMVLALAPSVAQAAPKVTVDIFGTSYDVTYTRFSYDSDGSKFNNPPTGQMPWWGNQDLTEDLANSIGSQLGLPNDDMFPPFFAWEVAVVDGEDLISGFLYISILDPPQAIAILAPPFQSLYYATASLTPDTPSAVPGPLPLFGAAAAFGMSRRLRRRCQLGG